MNKTSKITVAVATVASVAVLLSGVERVVRADGMQASFNGKVQGTKVYRTASYYGNGDCHADGSTGEAYAGRGNSGDSVAYCYIAPSDTVSIPDVQDDEIVIAPANPVIVVDVVVIVEDKPIEETNEESAHGNPGNTRDVGNAGENPNGRGTMDNDNAGGNGNGEHGNQGENGNNRP